MKNDYQRLFAVALSSAVLASLLTWSIGIGLTPVLQGSQTGSQPGNDALSEIRAQINALLAAAPDGKGSTKGVLEGQGTADYLASQISEAYLAANVTHANGLAKITPYASRVLGLTLSDNTLKDWPVWSAHAWDTTNFQLEFYPAGTWSEDRAVPTFYRPWHYPYYGNFALRIQSLAYSSKNEPAPAECAGEYSEAIKLSAAIFKQEYLPKSNVDAAELCQYIHVSEVAGVLEETAMPYATYTLDYPNELPEQSDGSPFLPTLILPKNLNYLDSNYTLATWLIRRARGDGLELVESVIKNLSADLTTRTVMRPCSDYAGCY